MKFSLAYQYYEESRHERGFQEEWLRHRNEQLDIASFNLDFDKDIGNDLLYYGVQYVYNSLNSSASNENIETGEVLPEQTRYPNGDNDYNTFAAYISYKNNFSEKYTMITGLRYSYFDIKSTLDTSASYYNFPFSEMNLSTGAFNGSLGLVYHPTKEWKLNMNLSSGFHAPNIDDMAKVFDSEPESVIMPNENLEPEYAYNADLGIEKDFGDRASFRVTGFYTWVQNKMVRREATFNGRDSIMYDGVLSQVHKVINAENAFIYGFNAALNVKLPYSLRLKADYTYTDGEDNDGEPLRHVAPAFGQLSVTYSKDPFRILLNAEFNSEISNNNLALSEQSKTHMYALNAQGLPYSPSWWTLNLKGSYHITSNLAVNAGVENILDVRYRPYSSGIVGSGRNFIVALRANF
jgi:hemoglobin/transferrin/lactoferrin receptor protein